MVADVEKVPADIRYSVSHANALHVYGGAKVWGLKDNTRDVPPDDTLLAAVMANRCPLVYCHERNRAGVDGSL